MNLPSGGRLLAALMLIAVLGCQEDLSAPGSCPANCPGGTPTVRDTILDALVDKDSTFTGYFNRGSSGAGLRVANGFLGATDYAVVRLLQRPDTFVFNDTSRTFTIDSVALEVYLLAHDTTVSGTRLALYRLPRKIDSAASFSAIDSAIVDSLLIDSVVVADSEAANHLYRFVFKDSTLSRVAIPAADSGGFAFAMAIAGVTPTGVRIGGVGTSGMNPVMKTYVTLNITDTSSAARHHTIPRGPSMTTFVSSVSPASDPDLLVLGTALSARALIRFPLPAYLRDTALLARATLELTPSAAMQGLPGDSAKIEVTGIRADFGAKSPADGPTGRTALVFGSADTVRIDVVGEVQRWQFRTLPNPPAFFLRINPEGASFTEPQFYSTRGTPAQRPRLHITYQLPYDFERP